MRRLISACQRLYASDLTGFTASITREPSGQITKVVIMDVPSRFAACAGRALRTANVPPYAGGQVVSTHDIDLSQP